MACLACKRRITMIKYAQIITIRYNPQGNAAPFVDSCLQFAKVLGRWRRLMHLVHGVAAHAEEARFQQSLCLGVWTAPPFPRFPKEQLQAVAEFLFPLPMAYPQVSGHQKAEIAWKWGRTAVLLLYRQAIVSRTSWSRKRGVWTFFCISYSKSRKSKRLGPMVSCILFLCFPVCLSHGLQLFFLFWGVGQHERCKKMQQDGNNINKLRFRI